VSQVTLARNRSLHFLDTQQPRVLHLEPVGRAAGAIRRVLPLRRDAYQPKLASMAEYELAVLVLDVLVEPDAGADFDQDRGERGLVDLEAARGAAGQQPPLPVPAGSRRCVFLASRATGDWRLMGPRGEAAN
jgi:hypothetical protein